MKKKNDTLQTKTRRYIYHEKPKQCGKDYNEATQTKFIMATKIRHYQPKKKLGLTTKFTMKNQTS